MRDVDEKKERSNKAWRGAWPMATLGLLCAVFYWDVLVSSGDHLIAGNDLANMFLHWLRFAVSSIRQGQFPLWNPYLSSGLPFVANPQPALFYPPTWLALLMPVTRALGLIIVLHLWLAGMGMYAWLRSERVSKAGALVGAAIFVFSGYFFVRVQAGHLGVITTGAWLPLILWAYRRAVDRRSWRLAVAGGALVGLSILAGHTASFVYVALGLVAYAVFHAYTRWRDERSARATALPMAWAGTMVLVGLALAAVQLLPTIELVLHSARQSSPSYEFASRFSWPPGYLLTLLVPNFFGEPTHLGYWGDGIYDESILYVGVLPLLLALLGMRLRHRLIPFLFALGLGALLLAFGKYSVLHLLLYRFVPLFQMARAPARAGFLFTLAAAAQAGLMVTALQSSSRQERERLLSPLKDAHLLVVIALALTLIVAGFAAFAWGRESNPAAGRLYHLANQTALFMVLFLLGFGLLVAWRGVARPRRAWVLALGLILLDLWTFGSSLVEPVDVQPSTYWRVVAQAVDDPQAARVLPWGLDTFEHNGGIEFGLRSVFGYDPLTLQRHEAFIASRPDPRARTYDLLNARYLVTAAAQDFSDEPDAPRLLLEESGVYVYERPGVLPRAWVASQIEVLDDAAALVRIHEPDFDPRVTALVDSPLACEGAAAGQTGEVEILRYGGSRIEVQARGSGGLLVFGEVYYPGWQATVNGEPAELIRADYLLRAVCVPAGEHQVTLVYDPPLLKIGLAITALALLVAGVAASQLSWVLWRR